MIKMIAFDLDGTALRSDGRVSAAVYEAFHQAAAAGIILAIASGRPYRALPLELRECPDIRYAIASNGAALYQLPEGKQLYRHCLAHEVVKKVVAFSREKQLIPEAFWNGQGFAPAAYVSDPVAYGRSGKFADYVRTTRCGCLDFGGFIEASAGSLDSIALVCPEAERKAVYMAELSKRLPNAYITTSGGDLIEIMDDTAGKAAALADIAKRCGIDPKETAAFGNGDNDADMLAFSGIGVAMADASRMCLEAAEWTVPVNDRDGVAEGIYRILRENE